MSSGCAFWKSSRGASCWLKPVRTQWLIYINVADVHASIARCLELGGKLLIEPRDLGSYGAICVILDPAGAVAALQSPPPAKIT